MLPVDADGSAITGLAGSLGAGVSLEEAAGLLGAFVVEAQTCGPVDRKSIADELTVMANRLLEVSAVLRVGAMEDARESWGAQGAAERLSLSPGYVRQRAPTKRAKPRTLEQRKARAVELYVEGWPAYRVGEALNMTPRTVTKAVRAAGIEPRETHARRLAVPVEA